MHASKEAVGRSRWWIHELLEPGRLRGRFGADLGRARRDLTATQACRASLWTLQASRFTLLFAFVIFGGVGYGA
jgi:hypothetical protein